jgi:hypothetical protein
MRLQIVEKCANAAASGVDNPLVVTGIVFVSVFGISSVIDCFFGTEGTVFNVFNVEMSLCTKTLTFRKAFTSCSNELSY